VRSVPGTCGSSSGSEDEGIRNRKGVHIAVGGGIDDSG